MPLFDEFLSTWDGWTHWDPAWTVTGVALAALGLWGSSRRDRQRRRENEAAREERRAAAAELPQAAPGAWQVRCPTCDRRVAASHLGIRRRGAGRKLFLGRCSVCDGLRWLRLERRVLRLGPR